MRIDRVEINGKRFYYVDGERIGSDALSAVIRGIFGKDVCAKVYWDVTQNNFVILERYIGNGNEQLIAQLDTANKKITALEKKVARLTIENTYLNA